MKTTTHEMHKPHKKVFTTPWNTQLYGKALQMLFKIKTNLTMYISKVFYGPSFLS